MITGFAMDTATGDSTSSLTFTGAITEAAGGKFISDGFATPPAGYDRHRRYDSLVILQHHRPSPSCQPEPELAQVLGP